MINQDSFKRAAASSTNKVVNADAVIERLNAALKDAPPKGQYDVIKGLITNREVPALKTHFGISEYVSAHTMRWSLINAFNDE